MRKKLKIFLLEPNYAVSEKPGFDEFMEPINLCYLASAAKFDGHEVVVKQQFDNHINDIITEIINYDSDVLALTFVTCLFNNAKRIVEKVKLIKPDIITIAGGSHVNGDPEECAKIFDYVVLGEGETPFVKLLESLPHNKYPDIPGVGFLKNGEFIVNNKRIRCASMGYFPFRDTLDMQKYTGIGNGPPPMPEVKFATMLLSRGCRFNCDFCINHLIWKDSGKRSTPVIKRNPTHVLYEMQMLNEKYNVGYIWFHDPDFPLFDRQYMQQFFKEKQKAEDVKYAFMTSINNIILREDAAGITEAEAFLKELKLSGCHMIGFGIETFSQEILGAMNKRIDINKTKKTLELVFNAGIIPVGFFIIGYPQETIESLNLTYKIAKQLKILRYRFSIFYPFKGSAINKSLSTEDWLVPEEESYDLADNEHQVVKCKMEEGLLEQYFFKMNTDIYKEIEYTSNLHEFYSKHKDMQMTLVKWKSNLKEIQTQYS